VGGDCCPNRIVFPLQVVWVAMQARDAAGRTPLDVAAAAGLWGHVENESNIKE
jgi:hypothetical protein